MLIKVFNALNRDITDIHSTFIFTVYDENKNRKVDFLGCFAIPILKVLENKINIL